MKWPKFYLAAIVVHLLVLFGLTWHLASPVPPPEKHYLEVTLEASPKPPAPTLSDPPPPPPQPTTELGLAPGKESDNPNATLSDTASNKPPSPPEAMARTPMAPTPDIPDSDFTKQAANKTGPDTPGIIGGSDSNGPTGGGGGTNPYKVVAVPEGISWQDAEVAALAYGGTLAVLNSEREEQFVFKLTDDTKYWRDTDNSTLGPWLGGDFHFKPRYDEAFEALRTYNNISPYPPLKNDWGLLFKGATASQHQLNVVETKSGVLSNGFVVSGAPVPLRSGDVSLAKGHFGNHTFEVFAASPESPGINWPDAEAQAHARGGYLAIIRTTEENNFVYNLTLQKAGAWRSYSTRNPVNEAIITLDLGPWLGGYKFFDKSRHFYLADTSPDGWEWLRPQKDIAASGMNQDPIHNFYWNHYSRWIGDGFMGHIQGTLGPVMALHYAKLHTESAPTWSAIHDHLTNRGYVVEYDDPPVTASK